ncbi:Hypothetical protein A7982_11437 [Minicystis rosea]|nr:Hypothetical protein A7982_11437 [Minicystis rosea]
MSMSMKDVIGRLRAQGDVAKSHGKTYRSPKPLPAGVLAGLKLPTGEKLPADLVAWLQYDAAWFPLLKKDQKAFRSSPLRKTLQKWLDRMQESDDEDVEEELEELMEDVGDDVLGYWLKSLPEPSLADVHAVVLPSPGSDQEHLLMLEPGRKTLRVLGCHKRIEFWWKYESFAAYLAHVFGFEAPP